MSKLAATLAELQPANMGRPRKLDQLLDDEDRAALIDRYKAGVSVRDLRNALKAAGVLISENPIIDLLTDAGVYRTKT